MDVLFLICESDTVCFRTSVKGWLATAPETLSALFHRSVLTRFGQVENLCWLQHLSAAPQKPHFVC